MLIFHCCCFPSFNHQVLKKIQERKNESFKRKTFFPGEILKSSDSNNSNLCVMVNWMKSRFSPNEFFFHHALKNCFLLSFVLSLFQQDIKNGVLVLDLVASGSKCFTISTSSFLKWTSENPKSSYSPKFDKIMWKKI